MGIDTYLTVMFWLGVVGIVARGLLMSMSTYPRLQKTTLGADIVSLFVGIALLVWVAILRAV